MTKSWFKSIVPISLCILLATQFVACNGNVAQSGSETPQSTASANNATTPTDTPENIDPFGKYEPEIELEFVRQTDDNIEKNKLEKNGYTWEDNIWNSHYRDKLGININYKWIVKGDQWDTKVNMMLANQDLPDFFQVNALQLKQMVDADLIEDMTSLFDNYATDFTKQILAESGPAPLTAATFDGKLYGLPRVYPSYDRAKFLYIRKDWLDNLGLEPPKTMDDVITIANAFATQDPDGNGVDDTYGLGLANKMVDGGNEIKGFSFGYNATPTQWIEKNGQLVYGGVQPEMKTVLGKLQELYSSGAIDREFGTKDFDKVNEDIVAGKIGMTYGEHWQVVVVDKLFVMDEKADLRAYPIPDENGGVAKNIMDLGTNQWIVARKGVEHPEAIVKMYNLMAETQYGKEFTSELQDVLDLSPFVIVRESNNLVSYQNDVDYFQNNVPFAEIDWNSGLPYGGDEERFRTEDAVAKWLLHWDREGCGLAYIYGPIEGSSMSVLKQYVDNGTTEIHRFIGAPTDTMGDKKAALDELQITTYTKIIQGGSLDEFDAFVENWNKLGGEQITVEVNDWYNALEDKSY